MKISWAPIDRVLWYIFIFKKEPGKDKLKHYIMKEYVDPEEWKEEDWPKGPSCPKRTFLWGTKDQVHTPVCHADVNTARIQFFVIKSRCQKKWTNPFFVFSNQFSQSVGIPPFLLHMAMLLASRTKKSHDKESYLNFQTKMSWVFISFP